MNHNIQLKIQEWTSPEYDQNTRKEIQDLVKTHNKQELYDRFWKDLEFGTGGLRGIRGAGTNRMNIYNIRKVTQGLANYILSQNGANKGVVIGRDSRILSLEFAREAATVLVANGIKVYFFQDICPTPIVSYTIIQIKAISGIMNTASHNPKEYNGYKVYWENGAQLTPPHDIAVLEEIKKINSQTQVKYLDFNEVLNSPLFKYCDEYIQKYLDLAQTLTINPKICKNSNISILYSPLHGCGYKVTPALLKKFGFKNIHLMEDQMTLDGTFPTVPLPNPEDPHTMKTLEIKAEQINADIFIATDPDADRIGVGYKNSKGNYQLLNGNQIGVLIFEYLIQQKKILKNSFLISTIVSSPLSGIIAKVHNIEYYETLTGFKWIASTVEKLLKDQKKYLFSFEESNGYNLSKDIMDKDGISATAMMAEIMAFYQVEDKYLDQVLLEIAIKYGYYKESQYSISFPGSEGVKKMQEIINNLRSNPPKKINNLALLKIIDYLHDDTGLPKSNVLSLNFEDNTRIIIRPSGTEPKIKFYFSSFGEVSCEGCIASVDNEHQLIKNEFLDIL